MPARHESGPLHRLAKQAPAVALANQLFGIGAIDPLAFGAVPLFLLLVATAAAWAPARRAMRVDAVQAMRHEQ